MHLHIHDTADTVTIEGVHFGGDGLGVKVFKGTGTVAVAIGQAVFYGIIILFSAISWAIVQVFTSRKKEQKERKKRRKSSM